MKRSNEKIDLLKLYAQGSHVEWNHVLSKCLKNRDINRLASLRRSIQIGMRDIARLRLNTPAIDEWFLRLNLSIELTAKKVIQALEPSPHDNPLNPFRSKEALEAKRRRDRRLRDFLKDTAY